jgi:hypothetical protein
VWRVARKVIRLLRQPFSGELRWLLWGDPRRLCICGSDFGEMILKRKRGITGVSGANLGTAYSNKVLEFTASWNSCHPAESMDVSPWQVVG